MRVILKEESVPPEEFKRLLRDHNGWHSTAKTAKKVYHNRLDCDLGDNISKEYLGAGTDDRDLCDRCETITRNENAKDEKERLARLGFKY